MLEHEKPEIDALGRKEVPPSPELHVTNAYNQLAAAKEAGLPGPFILISYLSSTGRGGLGQYWIVDRPGFVIDREAHWAMRGRKAFDLNAGPAKFNERKRLALEEAKAWANQRYGEIEWARNRAGEWLPAHINAAFPIVRTGRGD